MSRQKIAEQRQRRKEPTDQEPLKRALEGIVLVANAARNDVNETIRESLWAVDAAAYEEWDRSVWRLHDKLFAIANDATEALAQLETVGAL